MRDDATVSYETMLIGYTDAAGRFDAAAKERDQQRTFIAAFEALNWAVTLDEGIAKRWKPDGHLVGWKWRERVGHGAEIMGGVRYVRDRVHHQWANALRIDHAGRTYPRTYPVVFFEWVWRRVDELPEPDPRRKSRAEHEIYRRQLEGRPVRSTLDVINAVFYSLARVL